MCFAAAHWARISRIVSGTAIADVAALGFHELAISNSTMNAAGGHTIELYPASFRDACLSLLEQWKRLPQKNTY